MQEQRFLPCYPEESWGAIAPGPWRVSAELGRRLSVRTAPAARAFGRLCFTARVKRKLFPDLPDIPGLVANADYTSLINGSGVEVQMLSQKEYERIGLNPPRAYLTTVVR